MSVVSNAVGNILGSIADRLGFTIQSDTVAHGRRDYLEKGESYSVESDVSETLTDLICMFSSMPISGTSERAAWMDALADDFFQNFLNKTIVTAFLTGDAIVVPSWNGRNVQNVIVGADDFDVLQSIGSEITACAYMVDKTTRNDAEYRLMQAVELVPYQAMDGSSTYANRYRTFIARNDRIVNVPVSEFPQWADYDREWFIPNVDRLLIGRFKSFTVNPSNPNAVKGVPICFGASDAINEIHYLLEQMHNEFQLSEKFIMASRQAFRQRWKGGDIQTVLPSGKERVIQLFNSPSDDSVGVMHDWAPDIRYQAYLDALDKQERRVEHSVGVSSGIISTANDINYQNVDNVRKSQQKTMSFVTRSRQVAQGMLEDLAYAWDRIANFYNIVPIGPYEVSFDWSDDYIETFSDRQNAILAGEAIGATDAVDYRMFVMDESPEAARMRVDEIREQKMANRDAFFTEPTEDEE